MANSAVAGASLVPVVAAVADAVVAIHVVGTSSGAPQGGPATSLLHAAAKRKGEQIHSVSDGRELRLIMELSEILSAALVGKSKGFIGERETALLKRPGTSLPKPKLPNDHCSREGPGAIHDVQTG